jgi:hypothetical protein
MDLGPIALGLTLAVWGGAIIAMLHIFAVRAINLTMAHDLKVETHRLRIEYAERMAKLRKGLSEQVEVMVQGKPQE